MEFNKITRGANRTVNEEQTVYDILDAGFICHVGFQHDEHTMMIPTAYGRKENSLYIHGSSKNQMLNSILSGQTICICVTHVDGIVLAKTLFDTSANYRSAILFGKAQLLLDESERLEALKVITENIITGRWNEVPVGSQNQLKATMIIKFNIDRASAKVRAGGPEGDEAISTEIWSGHIPLSLKAAPPIPDSKFRTDLDITQSVRNFCQKNN